MRRAGAACARVLDRIADHVRPGVTTAELDDLCRRFIEEEAGRPATLGYRGYPKSSCISVNEVICHGIPDDRALAPGDILNIDITVLLDGWHGDSSRMYFVGDVSAAARHLARTTLDALWHGIRAARPGATLGDVGHAIQRHAEGRGCSVVREYCGHGIGRDFHCPPQVLHFGRPGEGVELRPGMFFTIEPMLNGGGRETRLLDDGWTVVTADGSLSAQYEHTVGITAEGCEVFTAADGDRRDLAS